MKKMFVISLIVNIILCSFIAIICLSYFKNETLDLCHTFFSVLENSYLSGIISGILGVGIVYFVQVEYSKRRIKTDIRCNEIIKDIFGFKKSVERFFSDFPLKESILDGDVYIKLICSDPKEVYDYYSIRGAQVFSEIKQMSFINSNILLDTIRSCFLINLNFEVLGIINEIKYRSIEIEKASEAINSLFISCKKKETDTMLEIFRNTLAYYLVQFIGLSKCWEELVKYLNWNEEYSNLFLDRYYEIYSENAILTSSVRMTYSQRKKIYKDVKKSMKKRRS